jgi:hypothetical protein
MQYTCLLGYALTTTWNNCCGNDRGSNPSGHAQVCQMCLLIIMNIVDVVFGQIVVWVWKDAIKPYYSVKFMRASQPYF